jgi:hypothetical protein
VLLDCHSAHASWWSERNGLKLATQKNLTAPGLLTSVHFGKCFNIGERITGAAAQRLSVTIANACFQASGSEGRELLINWL